MGGKNPIGVTDSGVGGLTLVKELGAVCPGEDIVYFGDSANCPYGNRSRDELFALNLRTLGFMREKGVKAVGVACNSSASLIDELARRFDFPVFSIVSPIARAIAKDGPGRVGVFATEFTISSGVYQKQIHSINPKIEVYGKGSPNLAKLVDICADCDAIDKEIKTELGALLSREPLEHVIWGCTHFPIVDENFYRLFPNVSYINPANAQATAIYAYLGGNGLLNPQKKGRLCVYTSGETRNFSEVIARLGILEPAVLESVDLL